MSTEQNTQYGETAWDKIQEALEVKDFDLADRIAKETKDAGFSLLSAQMYKVIATARFDYEANQEPDDVTHADGIEN